MDRYGYEAPELLRLADVVGHPVRLVAPVSNGPWYGFNGVQALVLTDRALYRVPQGYAFRAGRIVDRFVLSDIRDPHWAPRRGGRFGRFSFTFAGSRRSYASKWLEASELADELGSLLR